MNCRIWHVKLLKNTNIILKYIIIFTVIVFTFTLTIFLNTLVTTLTFSACHQACQKYLGAGKQCDANNFASNAPQQNQTTADWKTEDLDIVLECED